MGMASRRGRDLQQVPEEAYNSLTPKERWNFQRATSARYLLQDYIARYTHDRVPPALLEALYIIENARTPEDLGTIQNHPWKIVRDAVQDEIRVMEGKVPNSQTGHQSQSFGTVLDSRMSNATATGRQTDVAPKEERFDVTVHDLGKSPPRGTVHTSYPRLSHSLTRRGDNDGVVVQSQGNGTEVRIKR